MTKEEFIELIKPNEKGFDCTPYFIRCCSREDRSICPFSVDDRLGCMDGIEHYMKMKEKLKAWENL